MKTSLRLLVIFAALTGFLCGQPGNATADENQPADPAIKPVALLRQKPSIPAGVLDLVQAAREQFDSGDYRGAEKTYSKALAQAPENAFLLANKAVVLYREQKYQLAEEACQQALALAPQDDFSYCVLGIVEYQMGKFDEAINDMTKVLAIDPKNATAHHYLGILATHKGWTEAALKEFQTARTLIPNQIGSHLRQP